MGLVYDLAKCTPDLWTSPHLTEFDFVEASAYDALKAENSKLREALEFYASWRSWTWDSPRVNDSSELTNIRNDSELIQYTENDGEIYENTFGGFHARKALASLKGGPDGKV